MGAPFPDRTDEEWESRHEEGKRALVRSDFAPFFDRFGLLQAADVPPVGLAPEARPFRPPGGRGPLAVVPAGPLGEAVVRPYRRGGLPARFSEDRFLLGNRAFRELDLTLSFRAAGVPVVTPLAAIQSPARPGYRAALVTVRVRDAAPAVEALGEGRPAMSPGSDLQRDVLRRMGRSIRTLHGAGGFHADLNVHNFLVPRARGREVLILDLDRAWRLPVPVPPILGRLNLRRLRRSFASEGLVAARDGFDALRSAYLGEGVPGGEGCGGGRSIGRGSGEGGGGEGGRRDGSGGSES